MAGSIKGITIEFRGDTTKLDKALRQVNNETRKIDKELKNVDKALKFNPTSVELWRQKQQLLSQKISETKDKLDLLKQQQAQMDADGVDKQSMEYQKLQREIIETSSKLKTFEGQLKQVGNANLRAASEQFKQWGNNLTEAGQKMQGLSMAAAGVVAALAGISYKAGTNADDLNTLSKVYSINTGDLQKYAVAADLVDVSVEDIAKSHVKLEKSMYSAQNGSKTMTEAFDKLGVSITDSNGELRDGDEVWQEAIEKLGQMSNDTERDALAMQLMGKSAANLNPLIADQGETYKQLSDTLAKYDLDFVDQETLDGANQFNDALDTMKAIGSVALQTVGSQLASYLAPALEKVVDLVGKLAGWLSNLSPQTLTIIGIIASVVAAIAPVLLILGKLAFAVSSIMSLMSTLGLSIGALAGPVGIAIAVVGALIAIGVLLYKNWDTIKAKAAEIAQNIKIAWTKIKVDVITAVNTLKSQLSAAWASIKANVSAAWNAVKTAITHPIQTAVGIVKAAIAKIKGIINGAHFSLPHIKLPHFSISGKLSLNPPSIPHISVSWYKTGGIFDSPTIAGIGEAGPEAVVPLDQLWKKLDNIAAAAEGGSGVTINVYAAPGMDVNQIAAAVERKIVAQQKQRRAAWGY